MMLHVLFLHLRYWNMGDLDDAENRWSLKADTLELSRKKQNSKHQVDLITTSTIALKVRKNLEYR